MDVGLEKSRSPTKISRRPRGTYTVDQLHAAYDRFYKTKVNHVPVETLGNIIEALLAKTLVSEKASKEMLEIMSNAKTSRNRMMGKLPAEPALHIKQEVSGSEFVTTEQCGYLTVNPLFLPVVLRAARTVSSQKRPWPQLRRKATTWRSAPMLNRINPAGKGLILCEYLPFMG